MRPVSLAVSASANTVDGIKEEGSALEIITVANRCIGVGRDLGAVYKRRFLVKYVANAQTEGLVVGIVKQGGAVAEVVVRFGKIPAQNVTGWSKAGVRTAKH